MSAAAPEAALSEVTPLPATAPTPAESETASPAEVESGSSSPVPKTSALEAPAHAARWRLRPWAMLGPALESRSDLTLSGGAALSAGFRLGKSGWTGIGLRWMAPRSLPAIPASAVEASIDVSMGAWWSPEGRFAPIAGLTAGGASRAYQQGARDVAEFVMPVGGLEAGAVARLDEHLDLSLLARVAADASTTFVEFGERAPVALSPWAFGATLSLRGSMP